MERVFCTSSIEMSIPSAISEGVGSRPSSWSSAEVQRAGAVERHAHDAALLRQRLEDGLADPPDGVGDELDALGLVELVRGPDQAEVALVDQVGERDALVLVLLGDRHHEAQVAADQLVQRFLVVDADELGEPDLLFLRDQRIAADLPQVLVERPFIERGPPLA
jgi:hypothetical protein